MFVKGLGQQETHFMKHHLENFALQTLIKQFDQKEMINGKKNVSIFKDVQNHKRERLHVLLTNEMLINNSLI